MTDREFNVLDELYFLQSFDELLASTGLSEPDLRDTLQLLVTRKWVNCLASASRSLACEEVEFEKNYRIYYYLASKEGLHAHNSK